MSEKGVKQAQGHRKPRRRVHLKERDGVVGKECSKCNEWKPLFEYYKNPTCLGGVNSQCKNCVSGGGRNTYKRFEYRSVKGEKVFGKECSSCGIWKPFDEFRNDKRKKHGKASYCKECKKKQPSTTKRFLVSKYLPNTLSVKDIMVTTLEFQGCALTGDVDDIHWDHVIPASTCRVGYVYGNVIPLRSDINMSKGNNNIFEWFEANRQRFELSQERFDKLIDWLASANAMTVEEYRDYVYWCHANPRHIDEVVNEIEEGSDVG